MSGRKFVAFIPVRGGSKSIPLKNIKEFCGYPLVYWTIKAAVESAIIDTVYVSTDSRAIKDTVNNFLFENVKVIERGQLTATDTASTESAMLEFAENYKFDDVILIQATSPLVTSKDIVGGYQLYNQKGIDSVLSVVLQKRFIWKFNDDCTMSPVNYDVLKRPRRQEQVGYYVENGAFYISSRTGLLKSKCRLQGNIGGYAMDEETYFEIDEPSDWHVMEAIMKRRILENECKKGE